MEAFNKKLSGGKQNLSGKLGRADITTIVLTSSILAVLQSSIDLGPLNASIIYPLIFILFLIIMDKERYEKPIKLSLAVTIAYMLIPENLSTAGLITIFFLFVQLTAKASKNFSWMSAAVISQIGDAVTTFYGLQSGLSEKNPLLAPVLDQNMYSIFAAKAPIILLIAYIHFSETEDSQVIMKIIFSSGLYLTVSNFYLLSNAV